jgi:hypothetical protein
VTTLPDSTRADLVDRRVAIVFALSVVAGVIFDATQSAFWQRSHDMAPVGAVLLLLVAAAILRRHRWAWWFFLIVTVSGLPSWVIHHIVRHPSLASALALTVSLVVLALLLSTPMRRYVRVGRWRYLRATQAAPL